MAGRYFSPGPRTKLAPSASCNGASGPERIPHLDPAIDGYASAQGANDNGLHRGDLRVCRDGNAGNQYLSALAADHGGRSARIERRRHVDDLGFSRDLCRRAIDRRAVVGPVRPANTGSGRALPFRDRHDLVRVRRRPCEPAGRPSDTGGRRLRRRPCFHVRLRETCSTARRWQRSWH